MKSHTKSESLIVNGRKRPYPGPRLLSVLAAFDVGPDTPGVAVAINGEVVPRSRWGETEIHPDDELDLVGAVQGG